MIHDEVSAHVPRQGERNEILHACHLDVWEVAPVVLEATADKEGPEKGPSKDSLESSESLNMSSYCGRQLWEESG